MDIENIKSKMKKIDFSDIRILVVGILLMLVPIFFFVFRVGGASKRSAFSSENAKELLSGGHRGGFSFVQKTLATSGGGSPAAVQSMFTPPTIETEWKTAVEQIANERVQIPNDPNLSPGGRILLEAEMDNDLRTANDLLDRGKFAEAIPLLKAIMDRDSENSYLRTMASSNLCAAYEHLGRQEELEREFKRLVMEMEKLPPNCGFAAKMLKGLQGLAKLKDELSKAALAPESRDFINKALQDAGAGGQYTPVSFAQETTKYYEKQFPGLSSFK